MSRLQEDRLWVGVATGIVITLASFYICYTLNSDLVGRIYFHHRPFQGVTEKFIAILAVVFNMIPFIVYIIAKKDNAMRGVGILTMILALFVMTWYFILNHDSLFR